MASIHAYTTKSGARRYRVAYRTPENKPTSKRGFSTKRDAEQWRAQHLVTAARGGYVSPAAGRISFADVAADWKTTGHDLAPSTRARYDGIADALSVRFGALPVAKITRPLLREWVAEMVDAGTPAETVHKTAGVMRRILGLAVEDLRLSANPAADLRLPPIHPAEMRFLTLDQLRDLAAAAGNDAPAIWMLGICGLRMGELVGLRCRDVDRGNGVLHIVRSVTLVGSTLVEGPPKNRKRRAVPLPEFIAAQLGDGSSGDEPVFSAPGGGLIRHTNWRRRVFTPAVEAAGLFPSPLLDDDGEPVLNDDGGQRFTYDLHPHELRHTAASLAIGAGANIKAVQAMLGHARASITLDRYGHLYPADVEQLGAVLDEMIST